MSKAKKSNDVVSMYKHSFGHFKTEGEANAYKNDLQETHPKNKFQVVLEKRKTKYWKKYCVCEFISKQEKAGSKKVK